MGPATSADGLAGLPSAQLGKYKLIRRLAMGGMAELFVARATALHGFEKLVVLKRILPQHAESEEFIRMFLAEARLAATLHHPNIVQVYDIGEQGGAYFFTMEYVQGQDLRKMVRAARKQSVAIPLPHVLHIVAGVAAGLHHAHDKKGRDGHTLGIVHRDVSPSNVLITYEGGVKIVDFGIAKAASAQVHTVAGTLKGKIPYMSPEQCRGDAVDRRSDIFSIGTLLWEMTTGSRLFAGDNEFIILNRVAKGDVPLPSTICPDYPPELEAIVMKAMQPDPDDRYETALDMQVDIEDFSREARLPVSSARMARFMRELFAAEIEQTAAQAASEVRDIPATVPQPVFTPSPTEHRPSSESNAAYSASEVRVGIPAATPGPVPASQTGLTALTSSYPTSVPGQTRPVVAVAVVAAVLGVGGVATTAVSLWRSSGPPAQAAAPVEVVEAVTPLPDPDEQARSSIESPTGTVPAGHLPSSGADFGPEGGAAVGEGSGGSGGAESPAGVPGSTLVTGPTSDVARTPPSEDPARGARGKSGRVDRPVRAGKSGRTGKSGRAGKSGPKSPHKGEAAVRGKETPSPKYDPNSPLPPGM